MDKDDKKLEWMYKGANSLVDREDYLLGRSVDKTLEQLNEEEKEKKFVLPTPKNHVEHECIPPSIRDFNKIVQSEQVDLSAKLQEDPLVAIKKREEDARRQFLQNPVQLKKLQEALKAQQEKKSKKRKKHKGSDSDSDLDNKIAKKLQMLRGNPMAVGIPRNSEKLSKESTLDTILMHKFNALKGQLSEEDLQDILNGRVSSDSEEDDSERKKKKKKKSKKESSSEDSDSEKDKKNKKNLRESRNDSRNNREKKNFRRKEVKSKRDSSTSSEDSSDDNRKNNNTKKRQNEIQRKSEKKRSESYRRNNRNQSDSDSNDRRNNRRRERSRSREKYRSQTRKRSNSRDKYKKVEKSTKTDQKSDKVESLLERKIAEKLQLLRQQVEEKKSAIQKILGPEKPSNLNELIEKSKSIRKQTSSESELESSSPSSDSEGERKQKKKSFGLVTGSGKKIKLKGESEPTKQHKKLPAKKEETQTHRPDRNKSKRLTEEEKERMRREMMTNAIERDREREATVKRYREKVRKEEEDLRNSEFNKEFIYSELKKSTKHTTMEERLKSNLNNIQRSSRAMDSNFSKR